MIDRTELQRHQGDGLPFTVSLEAVNKCVGLIALSLPFALLAVWVLEGTCKGIDSISHYYYTRIGGDLLVGALFVIGTLLLFFFKLPVERGGRRTTADGNLAISVRDIRFARFAGLCAYGVALFPTSDDGCENMSGGVARAFLVYSKAVPPEQPVVEKQVFSIWETFSAAQGLVSYAHYASALGMFLVLAYFCLGVFVRPQSASAVGPDNRLTPRKRNRNWVYRTCGVLICVAILALGYLFVALKDDKAGYDGWNAANLTFWFEALALVSFGVAWSVKGRIFAIFRDPDEPGASDTARI